MGGATIPTKVPSGQPTGSTQKRGQPHLGAASLSGLVQGAPALRFRLFAGTTAPELASFRVPLPRGLRFVKRMHKLRRIPGVSVKGAEVESIVLRRGGLVVVLRRPVAGLAVRIRPSALAESTRLRDRARRHRVKSLKLTVVVTDAAGTRTIISQQIRNLLHKLQR